MTTHAQPQGKNPPKLISFDYNGDMTVTIEGKAFPVTINVGQVEKMQVLMDRQKPEPADAEGKAEPGNHLMRMTNWNYDALAVILNHDPNLPRFAREELPEKVPVHHTAMIVNTWLKRMLFNPGGDQENPR